MYAYYDDLQSAVLELQLHNVIAEYERRPIYEMAEFTSRGGKCTIAYVKFDDSEKIQIMICMTDTRGNCVNYEQISDYMTVEKLDGGRIYLCVKDMKIRIDGKKRRDIVC